MFCEVERSYIEDGFNLYGLRTCVSNFSDCLDLILDRIGPDDSDDSHLTQSACTLYGLIHARYIITAHGLDAMYNKVRRWNGNVTPRFRRYLPFIMKASHRKMLLFSLVRREGIWDMSFSAVRGATSLTIGVER